MRKSRFSPTQIAKILKEFDNGKTVADITREHGVSSAAFYKWRSKYAGMSGKELRRIKELEEENRKLKQMYANLALDHQMAKEIIEKKLWSLAVSALSPKNLFITVSAGRAVS